MTREELHNMLEEEARIYQGRALASIYRNSYQNGLIESEFDWIKANKPMANRIVEALLVDFINYIARRGGCDLGLKVEHIRSRKPRVHSEEVDERS